MKLPKAANQKPMATNNATTNNISITNHVKKLPVIVDASNFKATDPKPLLLSDEAQSTNEHASTSSTSSVKEKIMLFTSVTNLSMSKNLAGSKNSLNNYTPPFNIHKPPASMVTSHAVHKYPHRPFSQIVTLNKNASTSTSSPVLAKCKAPTPTSTPKLGHKFANHQSTTSVVSSSVNSSRVVESPSKNKNSFVFTSSNYSVTSSALLNATNNTQCASPVSGQANLSQLQHKNSFKSVKEKIAYFSANLKKSTASSSSATSSSKYMNRTNPSIEIISTETQNAIQSKRDKPKDWDSLKYAYNVINNTSGFKNGLSQNQASTSSNPCKFKII